VDGVRVCVPVGEGEEVGVLELPLDDVQVGDPEVVVEGVLDGVPVLDGVIDDVPVLEGVLELVGVLEGVLELVGVAEGVLVSVGSAAYATRRL